MDTETKAYNLYIELSALLEAHKELIRQTNSEPLFGVTEAVARAERVLFVNAPMADWEPSTLTQQIMALHDRTIEALTSAEGTKAP